MILHDGGGTAVTIGDSKRKLYIEAKPMVSVPDYPIMDSLRVFNCFKNHAGILSIEGIALALSRDAKGRILDAENIPINQRLFETMGVFSLVKATKYGTIRGRFRVNKDTGKVTADFSCSDKGIDVFTYKLKGDK